jgi:hypothetical protein
LIKQKKKWETCGVCWRPNVEFSSINGLQFLKNIKDTGTMAQGDSGENIELGKSNS